MSLKLLLLLRVLLSGDVGLALVRFEMVHLLRWRN